MIKRILGIAALFIFSFAHTRSNQPARLLFKPISPDFAQEHIKTNPQDLLLVAQDMLVYFNSKYLQERVLTESLIFEDSLLPVAKAKETLEFIVKVIQEDKKKHAGKYRILNPKFLEKHFDFLQWYCDYEAALKNKIHIPKWPDGGILAKDKIKITHYAVFKIQGSPKKTKKYNQALYEIIDSAFASVIVPQLSKQDIVTGRLESDVFKKHVKPLIWVTRDGLEEALMQGTAIVIMPDYSRRVFNVSKSNNMVYDKTHGKHYQQKRYWYFKEVKDITGKDGGPHLRIISHGDVAFAGDLTSLGLGKLIALRYKNPISHEPEIRLGVLSDRGSAFVNNLYQLDFFRGTFFTRDEFKKKITSMPNTTHAYLLAKK